MWTWVHVYLVSFSVPPSCSHQVRSVLQIMGELSMMDTFLIDFAFFRERVYVSRAKINEDFT